MLLNVLVYWTKILLNVCSGVSNNQALVFVPVKTILTLLPVKTDVYKIPPSLVVRVPENLLLPFV